MFGSYTAIEVEAERRREVLAGSMRDARGHQDTVDDSCQETPTAIEHAQARGLAAIAETLRSRMSQRT